MIHKTITDRLDLIIVPDDDEPRVILTNYTDPDDPLADSITIYAEDIRHVIAALVDAAVIIANQATEKEP